MEDLKQVTLSRRSVAVLTLFHLTLQAKTTTNDPQDLASLPKEAPLQYLKSELDQPLLIGQGVYSFWGFDVYRARLWSNAPFQAERWKQQSFALELTYFRDFEGKAIAKHSIAEISKQRDLPKTKAKEWSMSLEKLFPDVRQNQTLTGLYSPTGAAKFFHEGNLIGEIKEMELIQSFFNIWLSDKTSAPELRKKLINETT